MKMTASLPGLPTIPAASVESAKPVLVFLSTSAISLRFYRGQDEMLRDAGFEVVYVSSDGREMEEMKARGFRGYSIDLSREASPLRDVKALVALYRLFSRLRPSIVVAGTPKAGLLGTVAARLSRVPRVVFLLHGLRSETLMGTKRFFVSRLEKISSAISHRTVCVSQSLLQRGIQQAILSSRTSILVGNGSANGVDIERFARSRESIAQASMIRERLGLLPENLVIGFIGRFVRDKGIGDLVSAFEILHNSDPSLRLLMIGGFENGDPVPERVRGLVAAHPAIMVQDFTEAIHPWYHLIDVLVLPTYREGMPTVILEAQAAGVPVVTTRVTGTVDAVVEGETAVIVERGNVTALAEAVGDLLRDPDRRKRMGEAGKSFVSSRFRHDVVARNMTDFYISLLTC